jgi:hypothetical protein
MRKCLFFLAVAAIGCSSEGTTGTTTGRTTTDMTGSGGAGGTGGGSGGSSASGGSGGGTSAGGSGGSNTGGAGGNTGGTGGSVGGTGGSTGGSGGSGGTTGGAAGSAGSPDAGPDASGGAGGAVDASPPPDASPEQQLACTNFADAFCSRLQTCSSFVMSVLYGDIATCKQRWVLNCLPNFNVTGTSASAAKVNGCTPTLPALACDKFLAGDFGPMCTPSAGTIPQGGACGDDAQCATTFCARSPTSVCGTCQPPTNPGAACVQGSCSVSTNTICPTGANTCVKPKAGQVGDPCIGQEECDVGHQVGCNTATSKTCIALTLASGTCGANSLLNPTSVAVCGAGGTCTLPFNGTCTPFAADGQACSAGDTGAHCMLPAKCVGMKCVVPDPSTCK